MVQRYELTDSDWDKIRSFIPQRHTYGPPPQDPRKVLNGIFWIVRSGSPWRDLPERYGPWKTIYHRFNAWRRDGTFDRILQALQIRLDRDGHIAWDIFYVDGSNIRASKAASGAGQKGGPKSPAITRWVARAADGDRSSTWSVTLADSPSPSNSRPDKSTRRSRLKGS